jgi:hypothetical protein
MKNQAIKIIVSVVFVAFAGTGLQAQSLKFSKIPHPLSWVNKPVSYKINPEAFLLKPGRKRICSATLM